MAAPAAAVANPLPQALVLTAIVIGFGLVAFAFVLAYRVYTTFGTLDPDALAAAPESLPAAVPDPAAPRRPARRS
jgi:multicomponent Na+:H+ antiporter subunit C